MEATNRITLSRVNEVFTTAMRMEGGAADEGAFVRNMLFTRGILPELKQVRHDDEVQGGVALRATSTAIYVHPFVLRLVCTNGSVMARAVGSHVIEGIDDTPTDLVEHSLREAVHACCRKEALEESVGKMRAAAKMGGNFTAQVARWLARLGARETERLLDAVAKYYEAKEEQTAFGAFNAMTAVARGIEDAALRWSVEETAGDFVFGVEPQYSYA